MDDDYIDYYPDFYSQPSFKTSEYVFRNSETGELYWDPFNPPAKTEIGSEDKVFN
jgi:hypothetical protein